MNEDVIVLLIDYAFSFYKDRPDQAKVKLELLTNPSEKHVWHLFLKNYEIYNKQEPVRHIAKIVSEIVKTLKNECFLIKELTQLRELTHF
jgi:hypothetical protein